MKINNKLINSLLISILISLLFCFSSCKIKAEQKSLTDQFVIIDSLISQQQFDTALKELKNAEKKCYDKWTYLGIYKRYVLLVENEKAENILKKTIKENKDDDSLVAIYTDFLINNNRFSEAIETGKELKESEYASLYSEAVLRDAIINNSLSSSTTNSSELNDNSKERNIESLDIIYESEDLYDVYYNAYLSSKNPLWIKNCAIFDLYNGNLSNIINIAPRAYKDATDAYFWALALYDSTYYMEAVEALQGANRFLKEPNLYVTALLSDSYMALSDMDNANKAREELIFNLENNKIKNIDINDPLLPKLMTNSAIYAYNNNIDEECSDLLFFIVNQWPTYVPAIILYADYSWNSNFGREETSAEKELRSKGLKTLEMEQYDKKRKIPLSDAKYRVDVALEETHDPYLSIVQLDLKYKMDDTLNDKDKTRDLWSLLENSYNDGGVYHALLVQYALNFLIRNGHTNDAYDLLQSYIINSVLNYDTDKAFYTNVVNNIDNINKGILEFAGFFSILEKERDASLFINEYLVFDNNENNKETLMITPISSTSSCMNLADLYYSIGRKDKALELYGKLGGRESKKSVRSEVFYRIASIYTAMGDKKNALRSVEYACELYPENIRASLLKDSLRAKE